MLLYFVLKEEPKMWEPIAEPENPERTWRTESHRLKVPGGWILRTIVKGIGMNAGAEVSQIFIHDPDHSWQLNN